MTPLILRLRRLRGELAYAQRRVLELQTGISFAQPAVRSCRQRRQIAELDALWSENGTERPRSLSPNVR